MRQPPLTMGAAKESDASQKKSTDMVTGEAENEITAGYRRTCRTQIKPQSTWVRTPSTLTREGGKHNEDAKLYKTTEKNSNFCLVTYTFKVPITL